MAADNPDRQLRSAKTKSSFHGSKPTVLVIVLVVGTISIVDLRLLGVASLDLTVRRLMRDVIPYTWGAFVVAAITGMLLFLSDAVHYAHNFFFRGKLSAPLALAGFNMMVFHLVGVGDIERWDTGTGHTPMAAKAAATISLLLWIAVVASSGCEIGFTMHSVSQCNELSLR